MILPNKYLREDETLLGIGAKLLSLLNYDKSLSELWEEAKVIDTLANFERFVLSLDMLFILGLIVFEDNKLKRAKI